MKEATVVMVTITKLIWSSMVANSKRAQVVARTWMRGCQRTVFIEQDRPDWLKASSRRPP